VVEWVLGLDEGRYQHILSFFAVDHNASVLCERLTAAFPGVGLSGCTTAGEIVPSGMIDGAILLLEFPHDGVSVYAEVITDLPTVGVDRAGGIMRRLKGQLRPDRANS
jgi:hypothetical protein